MWKKPLRIGTSLHKSPKMLGKRRSARWLECGGGEVGCDCREACDQAVGPGMHCLDYLPW